MRIGRARVTATITLEDGSTLVSPDDERLFDRTMFERRYRDSWPITDEDGNLALTEEHIAFMAWVQCNRAALASKSMSVDEFDTWSVDVVEIRVDAHDPTIDADEGDAILPTESTAGTG